MPATIAANIMMPILLIDIVGHTTYRDQDEKNQAMRKLQELLNVAGKSVSPYRPFMKSFPVETTGDGYYLLLEDLPLLVALRLTQALRQLLRQYKEDPKNALPLAVRLVLAYGNVQMVGDQLSGAVMAEANRLISDNGFKTYQKASGEPSALFASALFYQAMQDELQTRSTEFPELATLPWQLVEIKDKHRQKHIGYVQGEATLDELLARKKTEGKSPARKPVKTKKSAILPAVETAILRRRYLERLQRVCNQLPLAELIQSSDQIASTLFTLDKVYIGLHTTSFVDKEGNVWRQEPHDSKQVDDDKIKPLTALEAVQREPLLVILGDPGSGKSSFINHLLWELAARQLQFPTPAGVEQPPFDHFPVRILLREWLATLRREKAEQYLDRSKEERQRQFVRCLKADLRAQLKREPELELLAPELERLLADGNCLLVFDGLDEAGLDQRRLLREALESVAGYYGKRHRIVVTCRVLSYSGDTVLPTFVAFTLASFTGEQVNDFIQRWYAALHQLGKPLDWTEAKTKNLEEAVGKLRPDMVRNPLLLTTLAGVHTTNVELPRQRVKLYQQAATILLKRWQEVRIGGRESLFDEIGLQDETKMLYPLWEMGYVAQQAGQANAGATDISRSQALTVLTANFTGVVTGDAGIAAARFLDYIDRTAGLLNGRGGDTERVYAFPHRTIQEYFAGCYLAKRVRGEGFNRALKTLLAGGDYWQLTANLGLEELLFNSGDEFLALDAAYSLCPKEFQPREERHWRSVLWAGDFALTIGLRVIEKDQAGDGADFIQRLRERLVAMLAGGHLPARERAEAGYVLGKLGDPRPGVCDFTPEMWIPLPGGTFTMGDDESGSGDDRPEHEVQLSTFRIGKYPITNAQYAQFMAAGGYQEKRWWSNNGWRKRGEYEWRQPGLWDDDRFNLPNQPVVTISWYEAEAFCRWLTTYLRQANQIGSQAVIRLPTKAQWEHAARGVDGREYPWGNDEITLEHANYDGNIGRTTAVGGYPLGRTPEGICDLSGNVWEWCGDWYESIYYRNSPRKDPQGPSDGENKVLRGGSWAGVSALCRCAGRLIVYSPIVNWNSIGVRVVVRDWS